MFGNKQALYKYLRASLMVKNPPANAADTIDRGAVCGLGRSTGGGNGNPLQYSSLKIYNEQKSPGRLQLKGSQTWTLLSALTEIFFFLLKK